MQFIFSMKLLSVFAVAFLLLQASSNAHPIQEYLQNSGKEIVTNILKVVLGGLDYIIDYIQEFDEKYAEDPSEVNQEEVDELLERGNQIFDLAIKVINKLFDNVERNTGKQVKKAMGCIRTEENNTKTALETILTDYAECINVQIPEIMASYQNALKALIETRATLQNAKTKLDECFLADLCLVQFTNDLKDLPKNLESIIGAAPPLLKVLEEIFVVDTPKCFKDNAGNISKTVEKLLGDVGSCIVKS